MTLLFTLVKLKTTGHGGEVYEGLLHESKGFFYFKSYLVVGWFMPKKIPIKNWSFVTFGIKASFSFKRKMASLETNVSVASKIESTLENNITIQNLVLEMEELKRAKERTEVTLAMLEANIIKEPMKCKLVEPEKFKEGGRVRIQAWLGTTYMLVTPL